MNTDQSSTEGPPLKQSDNFFGKEMVYTPSYLYNISIDKNNEEFQYLNLVTQILNTGNKRNDRTGTGTMSLFGSQMRFSLRENKFPLLTTKHLFYRGIVEELLWFIRGSTNVKELQEKNVHIWDQNSSRVYLDSLGLTNRETGDLGPVYGFQWRHFGASYVNMHMDYTGQGIDQLADIIKTIQTEPESRRIIMCAWNPTDLSAMALPPCHCLIQFYVNDDELSCHVYQRSADIGLGLPFNIASYALLTIMIAHVTGLKPGDIIISLGDVHLYLTHVENLLIQSTRIPKPFPQLFIKNTIKNINDFTFDDFDIVNYKPHPKIQMKMAV